MKKVLLTIGLISSLTATAAFASNSAFTKAEAQQNCPAATELTFTAINPTIKNSKGLVTAKSFKNIVMNGNRYAIQPQKLNGDLIANAQLAAIGSSGYGHNVNGIITCYYTYPGFTGINFHLDMRN